MYAIIQTAGKQYRVQKGTRIQVDRMPQEIGSDLEFPEVLLVSGEEGVSPKIGQPFVKESKVLATVVRHLRAPKVLIFKKRPKKGYRKMQGHRQDLTEIQIKEVLG